MGVPAGKDGVGYGWCTVPRLAVPVIKLASEVSEMAQRVKALALQS